MYLKRIKSLIENYNNECVKLTDNYSYYSRAFNTLKLILTPEEITEILKIEDTGIYTIVKKKRSSNYTTPFSLIINGSIIRSITSKYRAILPNTIASTKDCWDFYIQHMPLSHIGLYAS